MNPSRIAELLDPFLEQASGQRLTTKDLEYISIYIDILQHWNARVNLTAIRTEEEIVTRHFGESLFAACHLFPKEEKNLEGAPPLSRSVRQGGDFEFVASADKASSNVEHESNKSQVTLADLGSGAGFPGIPIKLWAPDIKLTLIESNHKKATFLREIVRALTLTDVDIQNTRAESLANISFNAVTLRAVERFDAILPVAASLLAPGGRLALLIGQGQLSQAQSALPNAAWSAAIPIPHSESRILAVAAHP